MKLGDILGLLHGGDEVIIETSTNRVFRGPPSESGIGDRYMDMEVTLILPMGNGLLKVVI